MTKKIVLATNNSGKLKEFSSIFSQYNIEILSQEQFKFASAQETGLSFIENAILKARHGCANTNLPCIADDSGLEVPALDGQPGIFSARFAGENANDEENINKLLALIENIPENQRQAKFRCVMVYMRHAGDPAPVSSEGVFYGEITRERRGENGFGYDPVFLIPELNKTCAELSPAYKNTISHRAKATSGLLKKLIANKLVSA